ncbi:MAG: YolD-like family protein [Muribaculaceae bacterium]|nr:YolD-like family protein [Muribaculaceae bacterium]
MSRYDDIINLPHHVSKTRTPMSMENRAAQFAPFAALTGHGAAIAETTRTTIEKPSLSQDDYQRLSRRLSFAFENRLEIKVRFFQPDPLKRGGAYREVMGMVNKVDQTAGLIIMSDKQSIALDSIVSIQSTYFEDI